MNKNTIIKLNQLNQDFYNQVAESFSQTRSQPWSGWEQLKPYLHHCYKDLASPQFLDIGCGNGRWAEYLIDNMGSNFLYYGVDNNEHLLKIAEQKLKKTKINHQLFKDDLVKDLINNLDLKFAHLKKVDCITAFGILHHLPSFELRVKFLSELTTFLDQNSFFIFSAWQFANDHSFKFKKIDPNILDIKTDELEPNDYFLGWQNQKIYRYCHHFDQSEINQLLANCRLKQVTAFAADGKSGNLNYYVVAQKNSDLPV